MLTQPMSEQTSTGVWSDYIYANGEKIAKVDSQEAVFHVQGYRDGSDTSCGVEGPLVGASPSVIGLTIQQGDQLVFDYQQNLPMYGGLALLFTDGVGSGDLVDTNGTGQPLWEDGETDGQWHHMVGSLTTHVGETVGYVYVGTHDWAPLGNFSVSLANAAVVHANGSTTPIFTGQQASVYAFTGYTCGGQAMTNGTVLMPITDPTMNTTYFLDDHLGTAQMQISGGGIPIWQGQFTPFGAELPDGSTDMHYKFTGKERDAESGLDYFGARYYASSMGRWMSPDWSAKEEPVPYAKLDDPQSLNLYGYVYNNPLSKADKDGHCLEDVCVVEGVAAVAVVALTASVYLSMPSTQRSLSAAGSQAISTVSSWFHKSDSKPAPADAKPQEPTSSAGGETAGEKFKPGERAEDAGKKCVYCGRQTTEEPGKDNSRETDHGQPRSKDGNREPENRNPSCRTCNRQKGNKTPEEFKKWQEKNPDKVPKAFLILPHWRDEERWLPVAA